MYRVLNLRLVLDGHRKYEEAGVMYDGKLKDLLMCLDVNILK